MSSQANFDLRDLQCKFIAFNKLPPPPQKLMSLPFSAGKSGFGGATVRSEDSKSSWNKCFVIGDDGLLYSGRKIKLAELMPLHTCYGIDDIRDLMRQLRTFTMASCSLSISNRERKGYMSGVWIQSSSKKYFAVTCAHYFKDINDNVISPEPGVDEASITSSRRMLEGEAVHCRLLTFDLTHDWAIFGLIDQIHAQQEVSHAVHYTNLTATTDLAKKDCFCVGYNCLGMEDVFQKEVKAVQSDSKPQDVLPAMEDYLHPEKRTIATGTFDLLGDDICHNVPGWYGISGAPMFTFENKAVQLVCLFQGGRLNSHDQDNYHLNKAVGIQEKMIEILKDL